MFPSTFWINNIFKNIIPKFLKDVQIPCITSLKRRNFIDLSLFSEN